MSGSHDPLVAVGERRIAIRMPNWLGDAMFALPTLRVVRARAPRARLELHARPGVAEVLSGLEGIGDEVVVAGGSRPRDLWRDAQALRDAAVVLLLPNSFGSAIPAWLARVPRRVGCAGAGRGPLLTDRKWPPAAIPPYRHYLWLVCGTTVDAKVDATSAARARGRAVAGSRSFAVLAPGAAHGSAKRWNEAGFAAVGRELRERGFDVLVLGTREEREVAGRVATGCAGRNLAGETRGSELVGLLALATVVIANDSGTLHLAAALGTAVVGVYGATSPAATGPIVGRHRVLFRPAPCSPCGLRDCARPRHDCMDAVLVRDVWAATRALLEEDRR